MEQTVQTPPFIELSLETQEKPGQLEEEEQGRLHCQGRYVEAQEADPLLQEEKLEEPVLRIFDCRFGFWISFQGRHGNKGIYVSVRVNIINWKNNLEIWAVRPPKKKTTISCP